MSVVRIEFDRRDGLGWRVRQQGEADVTEQQIIEELPKYAIQYSHRAYLDDKLVAEILL